MKLFRRLAVWMMCVLLFTAGIGAAGAQAGSYSNYPLYVVESESPNGYCYLYDQASDINGRNLGRYDNGAIVQVVAWNAGGGYAYVICSDGQIGYMHNYSLTAYFETYNRQVYQVYSTQPAGYCYLYDRASDIEGINLGRHENGEYVEIIDWNASKTYARVQCYSDGQYGYIRKTCLTPLVPGPYEGVCYVSSTQPKGYCYLYDQASDINGKNLGRHNNGETVYIINWDADKTYALVECTDGNIGYIRKTCLSW